MNQDSFAESHPLQEVNFTGYNRLSFNSYPCKDDSNSRSLLRGLIGIHTWAQHQKIPVKLMTHPSASVLLTKQQPLA